MKAHLEHNFRRAEASLGEPHPKPRPLFDKGSICLLVFILAAAGLCLWLGATWGR